MWSRRVGRAQSCSFITTLWQDWARVSWELHKFLSRTVPPVINNPTPDVHLPLLTITKWEPSFQHMNPWGAHSNHVQITAPDFCNKYCEPLSTVLIWTQYWWSSPKPQIFALFSLISYTKWTCILDLHFLPTIFSWWHCRIMSTFIKIANILRYFHMPFF